ncbi:MAG: head GIN domain-containing protein [Chthoniobacterales bacterium]
MNTITIRPFAAMKLITLAALALVLLLLNGCHWVGVKGNGRIRTETRAIQNFSRMEADGAFTVTWTTGPAALKITTDQNLFEYIRADVSDDRLRIDWVKPLRGTHGIKIEIASPSLRKVQLNGAVRLTASNLSGPEFYLEANGATRVTLSGNVNAMSGEMNGASRLSAESLSTRAMELSISGAGKAEVNVSEALKVDISGAGKVTYSGNPTVAKEISGAGSVRRRE